DAEPDDDGDALRERARGQQREEPRRGRAPEPAVRVQEPADESHRPRASGRAAGAARYERGPARGPAPTLSLLADRGSARLLDVVPRALLVDAVRADRPELVVVLAVRAVRVGVTPRIDRERLSLRVALRVVGRRLGEVGELGRGLVVRDDVDGDRRGEVGEVGVDLLA